MEKILFKWLEKVEYMLADTMPIKEEDPITLIEQTKQLKEVQRLIKWARRQKFSQESSGLNKPVVSINEGSESCEGVAVCELCGTSMITTEDGHLKCMNLNCNGFVFTH